MTLSRAGFLTLAPGRLLQIFFCYHCFSEIFNPYLHVYLDDVLNYAGKYSAERVLGQIEQEGKLTLFRCMMSTWAHDCVFSAFVYL